MANTIQFVIFLSGPTFHPPLQSFVLPFIEGGELQSLDVTAPGLHVAEMLLHDFNVSLRTQPGRIDLIAYKPSAATAPLHENLDFDHATALLRDTVIRIATSIGGIRLAVVTAIVSICSSREELNKHIVDHANGFIAPDGATDIDLRVNVRLPQEPSAVPINRIIRWQALTPTLWIFDVYVPEPSTMLQYGAFGSIDINSAPEAVLTPELIAPTYDLLVASTRPLLDGSWSAL